MIQQLTSHPFKHWAWNDRENRTLIAVFAIISIAAFIWLKVLYPFPNFLPDSYSYLTAAYNNQSINIWPIGYSMFLRLFSSFTRSDTALVFSQYFLLQGCLLYFLLTLRYWLSPSKWTFRIMLICCVANPLSLLISNFVASDAVFASLSLIWLAQLLTIPFRPTINLLIRHAIVVVLAILVRHNALYYPFVSLACIAFAIKPIKIKLVGIAAMFTLVGSMAGHSLYHYRQLSGKAQFSAFGGWQLASNALYVYAHVEREDAVDDVPKPLQPLHRLVNLHLDSLKKLPFRPDLQLGIYYLWDEKAPLKEYLRQKWAKDSTTDLLTRWASMGPLYAKYGAWLIRRHSAGYLRYFIWPNLVRYYTPDPEFIHSYNMGSDSVEEIARFWFHYKSTRVHAATKDISLADAFPIVLALINVLFILSFIGFAFVGGFRDARFGLRRALLLIGVVWLINMGFSVLASPIVLRYQLFPLFFTLSFAALLLEYIIHRSTSSSQSSTIHHETYRQSIAVS
ncbi:MAG TPA: hypothetical protein VHE34_09805 [Puia sp.]|uniref:hypothetical protein n=1 Tax=Puia sp. TaxID=2045100 RepID=UPI002B719929|nr:hypothetical protein [Puia sp.]HVU95509.1 hypothetical protein [Puia sp.]